MSRIIKIGADSTITNVEVSSFTFPSLNEALFGSADINIERAPAQRLTDPFSPASTSEARGVLPIFLVDENGRNEGLQVNELATRIYAPKVERFHANLVGDVYVIGEGHTPAGPDFVGLPDAVSVEAITKLTEMFENH